MSASRSPRAVTPSQLRAAMLGRPVDGVRGRPPGVAGDRRRQRRTRAHQRPRAVVGRPAPVRPDHAVGLRRRHRGRGGVRTAHRARRHPTSVAWHLATAPERCPAGVPSSMACPTPCSPRPTTPASGSRRSATSPTPRPRTTVYLAGALERPLLVEGPAGVGKTELAKAVAGVHGRRAGPAAVLRGPGRGARAVRVELQEAAAAHPGRAGRPGVGADPRRHLHRGVPAHPAAAGRDPPRPSRPCC